MDGRNNWLARNLLVVSIKQWHRPHAEERFHDRTLLLPHMHCWQFHLGTSISRSCFRRTDRVFLLTLCGKSSLRLALSRSRGERNMPRTSFAFALIRRNILDGRL